MRPDHIPPRPDRAVQFVHVQRSGVSVTLPTEPGWHVWAVLSDRAVPVQPREVR